MGNIKAMTKEKAKELVELFFKPNLEFPMEYAKKCAIKYCDDFMSLNENKSNSYWEGIKSEIENYEINNKLSSIEWYVQRMYDIEIAYNQGVLDHLNYIKSKNEAYESSKEMHKEEIKKAYKDGEAKHDKYAEGLSEGYYTSIFGMDKSLMKKLLYNETYGGNKWL